LKPIHKSNPYLILLFLYPITGTSQKEPKHAFSSNNFCLVNASTVASLKYRAIQQARLTLSHVYNEVTTEPTMAKNTFCFGVTILKSGTPLVAKA
jgi:hypothetical protein